MLVVMTMMLAMMMIPAVRTIQKGRKGSQLSIQCNHMVMEAMMMMR